MTLLQQSQQRKMRILVLAALAMLLSGCARHPDCLKADMFGHCRQWKGQKQSCKNPDFLGFCPGKTNP